MIYVDSDPLDIIDSPAVLAHQMQHLSHYNIDPDEEHWINEGLSELSEFLMGYTSSTESFNFPVNHSLIDWGDVSSITTDLSEHPKDFTLAYLMFLYLYEQYFPVGPGGSNANRSIKTLLTNPSNGIESVNEALAAAGYSVDFDQIFDDWAVASYLDITDSDFYDGKYGFNNADVSVGGFPLDWGYAIDPGSPYYQAIPHWGVNYWRMKANLLGEETYQFSGNIVLNGEDTNRFGVHLVRNRGLDPAATSVVDELVLDERQVGDSRSIGDLQFGPEGGNNFFVIAMVVTCKSDSGASPSPLVISDDLKPDTVLVAISQNPVLSQFLDIYVFSNERIFEDGSQLTRSMGITELVDRAPEVEMPIVWVYAADDTARLAAEAFYGNDQDGDFVYKTSYEMKGSGSLEIQVDGEDPGGNRITQVIAQVQTRPIRGDAGGLIASADGLMSIKIPPGALAKDTWFTLLKSRDSTPPGLVRSSIVVNEKLEPASDIYHISPDKLNLKLPATLVMKARDGSKDPVGLFRWSGEKWEVQPCAWEAVNGRAVAEIERLGAYRLYRGGAVADVSLPFTFQLSQNYPNPFNPQTWINFQLPGDGRVELVIYNALGQVVRRLLDETRPTGNHRILWDGRDNAGRPAASGIYYYRLKSGGKQAVRKMVLLK
jgi:hypothetical protein